MGVKRAANMAAAGASRKEIKKINPGLSSSKIKTAIKSAQQKPKVTPSTGVTSSATKPSPNKFAAIKSSKSLGLGQALKIAASKDAAIGTKEFKTIQKVFGISANKLVGRVDKLNEKFGAKFGNIGIKGNTANRYARGGFGPTTGIGFGNTGGPLANALAGMNDTYSPMRQGQGGYKIKGSGKAPKGSSIWGFANDAPLYRETTKGTSGWGKFAPSLLPKTTDTADDSKDIIDDNKDPIDGGDLADTDLPPTEEAPMSPEEMAAASTKDAVDPFGFSGAFSWRANKGKKGKGIKSTKASSGGQATAPIPYTLGM